MTGPGGALAPVWSFRTGDDPSVIHALLIASDRHHAATYGLAAPVRSIETSQWLARSGAVQLLMHGERPAAMFALTAEPPFTVPDDLFPGARSPLYLQRLAIEPDWLARDPLLGARCLRRAVELAEGRGADALRSEANPDLTASAELLSRFGFVQCGPALSSPSGLRRVYLQKDLS
jgi:hypothetical protein